MSAIPSSGLNPHLLEYLKGCDTEGNESRIVLLFQECLETIEQEQVSLNKKNYIELLRQATHFEEADKKLFFKKINAILRNSPIEESLELQTLVKKGIFNVQTLIEIYDESPKFLNQLSSLNLENEENQSLLRVYRVSKQASYELVQHLLSLSDRRPILSQLAALSERLYPPPEIIEILSLFEDRDSLEKKLRKSLTDEQNAALNTDEISTLFQIYDCWDFFFQWAELTKENLDLFIAPFRMKDLKAQYLFFDSIRKFPPEVLFTLCTETRYDYLKNALDLYKKSPDSFSKLLKLSSLVNQNLFFIKAEDLSVQLINLILTKPGLIKLLNQELFKNWKLISEIYKKNPEILDQIDNCVEQDLQLGLFFLQKVASDKEFNLSCLLDKSKYKKIYPFLYGLDQISIKGLPKIFSFERAEAFNQLLNLGFQFEDFISYFDQDAPLLIELSKLKKDDPKWPFIKRHLENKQAAMLSYFLKQPSENCHGLNLQNKQARIDYLKRQLPELEISLSNHARQVCCWKILQMKNETPYGDVAVEFFKKWPFPGVNEVFHQCLLDPNFLKKYSDQLNSKKPLDRPFLEETLSWFDLSSNGALNRVEKKKNPDPHRLRSVPLAPLPIEPREFNLIPNYIELPSSLDCRELKSCIEAALPILLPNSIQYLTAQSEGPLDLCALTTLLRKEPGYLAETTAAAQHIKKVLLASLQDTRFNELLKQVKAPPKGSFGEQILASKKLAPTQLNAQRFIFEALLHRIRQPLSGTCYETSVLTQTHSSATALLESLSAYIKSMDETFSHFTETAFNSYSHPLISFRAISLNPRRAQTGKIVQEHLNGPLKNRGPFWKLLMSKNLSNEDFLTFVQKFQSSVSDYSCPNERGQIDYYLRDLRNGKIIKSMQSLCELYASLLPQLKDPSAIFEFFKCQQDPQKFFFTRKDGGNACHIYQSLSDKKTSPLLFENIGEGFDEALFFLSRETNSFPEELKKQIIKQPSTLLYFEVPGHAMTFYPHVFLTHNMTKEISQMKESLQKLMAKELSIKQQQKLLSQIVEGLLQSDLKNKKEANSLFSEHVKPQENAKVETFFQECSDTLGFIFGCNLSKNALDSSKGKCLIQILEHAFFKTVGTPQTLVFGNYNWSSGKNRDEDQYLSCSFSPVLKKLKTYRKYTETVSRRTSQKIRPIYSFTIY